MHTCNAYVCVCVCVYACVCKGKSSYNNTIIHLFSYYIARYT